MVVIISSLRTKFYELTVIIQVKPLYFSILEHEIYEIC